MREIGNLGRYIMRARYWSIEQLPGLTTGEIAQLKACGINTTGELLEKGRSPQLQQILANQLKIPVQYVRKWGSLADLARLPSVGLLYCGLLLHAGITSVSQLSQTHVQRLRQQILRLQVATMQRRDLCPTIDNLQQWIKEARSL